MNIDIIKRNFDTGLWNLEMVKLAVVKGVLTEAQFTEITSQPYL